MSNVLAHENTGHEITAKLQAWGQGDQTALQQLTPLVYQELHRLAHRHLQRQRGGHSLHTTALVNEAWVRLAGIHQIQWQDRTHFFAVSAQLMRHILVDFARQRLRHKRGGLTVRVALDEAQEVSLDWRPDIIALDEAWQTLATLDPRQSRVVELRFFGGLSLEETATALGVSVMTVRRDWQFARVWLHRQLSK